MMMVSCMTYDIRLRKEIDEQIKIDIILLLWACPRIRLGQSQPYGSGLRSIQITRSNHRLLLPFTMDRMMTYSTWNLVRLNRCRILDCPKNTLSTEDLAVYGSSLRSMHTMRSMYSCQLPCSMDADALDLESAATMCGRCCQCHSLARRKQQLLFMFCFLFTGSGNEEVFSRNGKGG